MVLKDPIGIDANRRVKNPQMICQVNDKIHLSDDTVQYLTDRRQLKNVVKMTSRCVLTW
jgi:hypothetical protein